MIISLMCWAIVLITLEKLGYGSPLSMEAVSMVFIFSGFIELVLYVSIIASTVNI